MHAYITLNEKAPSFLNSKWLLWMFRERYTMFTYQNGIQVRCAQLPFSEHELMVLPTKSIKRALTRCFTNLKKDNVHTLLLCAELRSLDYLPSLCASFGFKVLSGESLHEVVLPEVLRLLTKEWSVNLQEEKITLSTTYGSALKAAVAVKDMVRNIAIAGGGDYLPIADTLMENYGVPVQITKKAGPGILLHMGGTLPLLQKKCRVIDFTERLGSHFYTIVFHCPDFPAVFDNPTLGFPEAIWLLDLLYPGLSPKEAYAKSGYSIRIV